MAGKGEGQGEKGEGAREGEKWEGKGEGEREWVRALLIVQDCRWNP